MPAPSLPACRKTGCPSLYEQRTNRPPARDLVQDAPSAPWYGCASQVGHACRLCGERPDLAPKPGQQVGLFEAGRGAA